MNRTPIGAKRCDCGTNIAVSMKACSACKIKTLTAELEKLNDKQAEMVEVQKAAQFHVDISGHPNYCDCRMCNALRNVSLLDQEATKGEGQ